MKEQYLNPGYVLHNKRSGVTFQIKEMIGKGSSCAVYLAECRNLEFGLTSEHLLKEYNPRILNIQRNDEGTLIIEPEEKEAFNDGLKRFRAGYKKQSEIRRNIKELRNETTNIQDIFSANGTDYIDMTLFTGMTYEKVAESSLYDIAKRIRTIARTIGCYHKAGYLHLDIKPENIFTIPETCELVMLFDFDSVVEKETVCSLGMLSYTKEWAAPEQFCLSQRRKICEATDLFAIGEILYYKVFNKHSSIQEHRSFSEYVFEKDSELFKNVNPAVFPVLTDIFRHTITTIVSSRYQNAEELIVKLDQLIELAATNKLYLKKILPQTLQVFLGRNRELKQIHDKLASNQVVVLNGIGGIGKTELAKQYARKYMDEYDSILFLVKETDWLSLADQISDYIVNFSDSKEEDPEERFNRVLRILGDNCNEKSLFIIDNVAESDFCDKDKKYWKKILDTGARVIFTTRSVIELFENHLQVNVLRRSTLYSVFKKWYSIKDTDKDAVNEIIELVGYHTLTIELIAKQLRSERITSPVEKLNQLKEVGLLGSTGRVTMEKDGASKKGSAFDHISALFDLSKLESFARFILSQAATLPIQGIPEGTYYEIIDINTERRYIVTDLIDSGWLIAEKGDIRMHPVINEVVISKTKDQQNFESLTSNIIQIIESRQHSMKSQDRNLWRSIMRSVIDKLDHLGNKEGYFLKFAVHFDSDSGLFSDEEIAERGKKELENAGKGIQPDVELEINRAICNAEVIFNNNDCMARINRSKELLNAVSSADSSFYKAQIEMQEGTLLDYEGKHAEAINKYENAFSRFAELEKKEDMISALSNIGIGYENLGEYDQALKKDIEAYKMIESFGYNDIKCDLLRQLGSVYRKLKDFKKAEEYARTAVEEAILYYGEDSPESVSSYMTLGLICAETGNFEEAERFSRKAFEIRQEHFGKENDATALAESGLGCVYCQSHNVIEAERLMTEAVRIFSKIHGRMHAKNADIYTELGQAFFEIKDYEKAEKYFVESLSISESACQEHHQSFSAIAYRYLGEIQQIEGNPKKAEEYLEKALEFYKRDRNHDKYLNEINTVISMLQNNRKT